MFAKDAEDGLKLVVEHLQQGRKYQYGNIILADRKNALVIEIAGGEHTMEWSQRKVLRTSHHIMLDNEPIMREEKADDSAKMNSEKRVDRGYELLRQASTVNDVFTLLKDHGEQKGQASLCRHPDSTGDLFTAMSYVTEVDFDTESGKPRVLFHVAKGNPCESEYKTIPLVFPADEDIMKRATEMYFS